MEVLGNVCFSVLSRASFKICNSSTIYSRIFSRLNASLLTQRREFSAAQEQVTTRKSEDSYCTTRENGETARKQVRLENRNPRNPEHFGYNKPRGYETQHLRRDFYCRLRILFSNRHIDSYVEHHTGVILASSSTKEFRISRHLYKTTDCSAAYNIGRVLRQRCIETGITKMLWQPRGLKKKARVKAFKEGFSGRGISLMEPKGIILAEQIIADGVYKKRSKKSPYHQKKASEKRWYT